MALEDLTFGDGRVTVPDGIGSIVGAEPNREGEGWGGLTVEGPLSYFGGGTQDIVKLSSQTAGQGVVILAINPGCTDYEPFEIRGETIKLKIRIPDPNNPTGPSAMSEVFLTVDSEGIHTDKDLLIDGALAFDGAYSYIKVNSSYGLRINNGADTANLITIEDDGRLRLHSLAGSGTRALGVNSQGYVVLL